jgi:hypothetical protein
MMAMGRSVVIGAAAVLLGALVLVTGAAALGGKPPVAPPGISQERAAQLDAERQSREQEFLTAFVASGRDPHALPRTHLDAIAVVAETLKESVAAADAIVIGVTEQTRFVVNPSGGLPTAKSVVRISEVVKSDAALPLVGQTLDLFQAGGPMPYPAPGGSLRELDVDELVLPSDQVVLFVTYQPRVSGFSPLAGSGVYFVRAGTLTPEVRNRFGTSIRGRSVSDLLVMIAAASR